MAFDRTESNLLPATAIWIRASIFYTDRIGLVVVFEGAGGSCQIRVRVSIRWVLNDPPPHRMDSDSLERESGHGRNGGVFILRFLNLSPTRCHYVTCPRGPGRSDRRQSVRSLVSNHVDPRGRKHERTSWKATKGWIVRPPLCTCSGPVYGAIATLADDLALTGPERLIVTDSCHPWLSWVAVGWGSRTRRIHPIDF